MLLFKKLVLNFIMDAQQPFLRARCAIAKVCVLYLKLSCPLFRGSKLERKLMRRDPWPERNRPSPTRLPPAITQ